jgi:glycosyltransferase involved in cell wall biosynthesis
MQTDTQTMSAETPAERTRGSAPAAHYLWHLITGEYPPQVGGVADYTALVAAGLAAEGDRVHVWCPGGEETPPQTGGVTVHRELGAIGPRDLRRMDQNLDRFPAPRRVLVQWVPHGFGYRSMNLPFCLWLRRRAVQHGDRIEVMVHEPFLSFRKDSLRQNLAALVHRLMTMVLLRRAQCVWMSIPDWERRLRPYALGRTIPYRWVPIPSNIAVMDRPDQVRALRERYASQESVLIGHFGTYGSSITSLLEPILLALAEEPGTSVLLMGKGSDAYRDAFIGRHPHLGSQVQAAGSLSAPDLSCHVSACDVLLQPYPDGVSTRRTSFMLGLSHGKAVVSNLGALSEEFWKDSQAVVLAPSGDAEPLTALLREVCSDRPRRASLGRAARNLYQERFDVSYTVGALRSAAAGSSEAPICES